MRKLLLLIIALGFGLLPEQSNAQNTADIVKGAQVWAENCMRCHNARSPLERSDREWYTIVQHMRARANLTRREALTVSVYLQSSNGIGTVPAATSATPTARNNNAEPVKGDVESADQLSKADSASHRLNSKEINRLRDFVRQENRR